MMAPPCSDQLPPSVPINPRPPFRDDVARGVRDNGSLRWLCVGSASLALAVDDRPRDELRLARHLAANPALAVAEFFYWTRKLQARFFAGDYASGIEASSRARRQLWSAVSQLETADYPFYGALSRAAVC